VGEADARALTGLSITLIRLNFSPAAGRDGEGNGLMVWEAFKVYGGEIYGRRGGHEDYARVETVRPGTATSAIRSTESS
jgi:hypothetical protein